MPIGVTRPTKPSWTAVQAPVSTSAAAANTFGAQRTEVLGGCAQGCPWKDGHERRSDRAEFGAHCRFGFAVYRSRRRTIPHCDGCSALLRRTAEGLWRSRGRSRRFGRRIGRTRARRDIVRRRRTRHHGEIRSGVGSRITRTARRAVSRGRARSEGAKGDRTGRRHLRLGSGARPHLCRTTECPGVYGLGFTNSGDRARAGRRGRLLSLLPRIGPGSIAGRHQ